MTRQRSWTRRLLAPVIRRGGGIARDEKGAVAVEFAILALPFFTLIFATLETSITFLAQQVLESALQDATRYIRTGQSQTATPAWNETEFRKAVCDGTYGLFECTSNPTTSRLLINVTPVTTFNDAADELVPPIDDKCSVTSTDPTDCDWQLAEAYDDGKGSDVIIVQAFYKWPTIVNLPWFNLANQAGSNRLLSAVRVFKNEPF